jgi:hypothetical protein
MLKRELQRICKEKDLPKSGTKLAIIDRLLKSCTIQELLINTEKNRQSIGKYLLDSELLELRLALFQVREVFLFRASTSTWLVPQALYCNRIERTYEEI